MLWRACCCAVGLVMMRKVYIITAARGCSITLKGDKVINEPPKMADRSNFFRRFGLLLTMLLCLDFLYERVF